MTERRVEEQYTDVLQNIEFGVVSTYREHPEMIEAVPAPVTLDEIGLCLKRLLKSATKWNWELGRQGYLNFIVRYVR